MVAVHEGFFKNFACFMRSLAHRVYFGEGECEGFFA